MEISFFLVIQCVHSESNKAANKVARKPKDLKYKEMLKGSFMLREWIFLFYVCSKPGSA